MHRNRGARRSTLAAVAGLGLVGAMLPMTTAGAAPEGGAEVDSALTSTLEANGTASAVIFFGAAAESADYTTLDWSQRGTRVYRDLVDAADASQADARAKLEAMGVDYQSFWINNTIIINDADQDTVEALAELVDVQSVSLKPADIEIELPAAKPAAVQPDAVTWGISDIKAPQVWQDYTKGDGITIGVIDSGVQFDHPALVDNYRGNNGDGSFTHDYNWYDATDDAKDVPSDDDSHGTHTTGTAAGTVDNAGNNIGVAPEASWVHVDALQGRTGSYDDFVEGVQWFVAPTDTDGNNADPDQRPNVINGSLGFPDTYDPVFEELEQNVQDAGIFASWSIGNSGPECNTGGAPGTADNSWAVGNYQEDHTIQPQSSRGGDRYDTIKPNISAPGTNTRSALPGDDYGNKTGTSMSSPHMAGSVALLWAAAPGLVGDIEGTRAAFEGTAIDSNGPCGGDETDNGTFGEGRLDVLAAVQDAAPAPPLWDVARVSGDDRYGTAAAIAGLYEEANTVFVVSGSNGADGDFSNPDAVAGAPGASNAVNEDAGGNPAPVLLTESDEATFNATSRDALEDIDPANVVILGGTASVPATVQAELTADGYAVQRIDGEDQYAADRYATAAELAGMFDSPQRIYVASGENLADALPAGAIAGRDNSPVVLVKPDAVPQATADVIADNPEAEIILLGGPNTVSDEVMAEVGAETRWSGATRLETSWVVAEQFGDTDWAHVADGRDGIVDALTGSALAGSQGAPVLLLDGDATTVAPAAMDVLKGRTPETIGVLGGTNSVSTGIEEDLADETE